VATLTAKDIAELIQRPGEPPSAAVNRLRNWVSSGIINAVGGQHPGTGYKRRFAGRAVLDAMLLQQLTDTFGSPAVSLVHTLAFISTMVRMQVAHPRTEPIDVLVISGPIRSRPMYAYLVGMERLARHISESDRGAHAVINLKRLLDRLPPDWMDDFPATQTERAALDALHRAQRSKRKKRKGKS
jgi:hypothetical protein